MVANSYQELFAHHDPNGCPIKECELLKVGCRVLLDSPNLLIETQNPWKIKAQRNQRMGYVEKLCIRCRGESGPSGRPYEEIDNLEIEQISITDSKNYPFFKSGLGHFKISLDEV